MSAHAARPAPVGVPSPTAGGPPTPASFRDRLYAALEQEDTGAVAALAPCLVGHAESCLPELLAVFDSERWDIKRRAADLFKQAMAGRAEEILLPMLSGDSENRCFWAATILGELGERGAIPPLIANLQTRSKTRVLAALKALASFPEKVAREALLQFFLTTPDPVWLGAALKTLVPLASEFVPLLLARYPQLATERKAWVLKYLAEVRAPQALPLFSDVLRSERHALGLFAIAGLGHLGTPEAATVLAPLLDDRDWFVRKRVVEALGQAGCQAAVPPLLRAVGDPSPQVQASARESLSKVGRQDLPAVLACYATASPAVKVGLVQACGGLPDPRILDLLRQALADRELVFFALEALGNLGLAAAKDAIVPFMKDTQWFVRLNAVEALGRLPLPEVAALIEPALADDNEMVRQAAQRLYAHRGNNHRSA